MNEVVHGKPGVVRYHERDLRAATQSAFSMGFRLGVLAGFGFGSTVVLAIVVAWRALA